MNQVFATNRELFAGLIYINPLINPGSTDYLDYYIEDTNFISFGQTVGTQLFCYAEDYSIQTDESLLPFTQNKVDQGIIIPPSSKLISYGVYNGIYGRFFLYKSS